MAISNRERVGKALEQLRPELAAYVEQELRAVDGEDWRESIADGHESGSGQHLDNQRLLTTMIQQWEPVFETRLPKEARNCLFEIRKWRNKHAHDEPFNMDETLSALIDIQQLLEAIQSNVAEEIEKSKLEMMRLQFETERKKEEKKAAKQPLAGLELAGLRPWREIITPHQDVAEGSFQQAEFAADLWQVYKGGGGDEYRDPVAFYGRTYLTDGLKELLANAANRLSGTGGDPVVELQINFGGGKTHSMLALYHLFGGQAKAADLAGVEEVLQSLGLVEVPVVRRAVIVGTVLRPGSPMVKDDGTVVNTLWGEIAWQLAGKEGFELLKEPDSTATNPGELVDRLFALAGPSLILIDEWVAYARQLWDRQKLLTAGDFDTQFTFAQTLCEAAKRAKNVLVCISIPASVNVDGSFYSYGQAGDQAGQVALDRLKDAVGRSNLVWRPATSDESFEIVRRRLFEPIPGDLHAARDAVVREFAAFYHANPNEFPSECREGEYERRMRSAYPIHPELFDRLYTDWSSLEKFQRTRGVLRLMAAVIHSLWKNNDQGALILPASIPLADKGVQSEITRYLPDTWPSVIDRDIDGDNSVPQKLDLELAPTLGRYSACRRVARTVFLGSAPTIGAATKGIDGKRISLGCVQPKEAIATFRDALSRLTQKTMFLYADGSRYWFNTQASINREAQDRAERFKPEEVEAEILKRLRELTKSRGEFKAIHVDPPSSDVEDNQELRLVVLGPKNAHRRGRNDSPAIEKANEILQFRGSAPRTNRNRLVFVAADEGRVREVETAVRQFLAWSSIVDEVSAEKLDLDKANRNQAKASANENTRAVTIKINEVYQYALVPEQNDPKGAMGWAAVPIPRGDETLATRVMRKLEPEHVTRKFGGTVLMREMDRIPLWGPDGNVEVSALWGYYSQYPYLSRLLDENSLFEAIRDAVNRVDGIAYADSFDKGTGKYSKLRTGILLDAPKRLGGWVVQLGVALPIIDEESREFEKIDDGITVHGGPQTGGTANGGMVREPVPTPVAKPKSKKRFHATIEASANNLATLAGDISREVAQHLAKNLGTTVRITIELDAESESGYEDDIVRVVNENCQTLRFQSFEFEEE